MSNYWGYGCISHDPPILMDDFGGAGGRPNHAFDALVAALPVVRAGRWPMVRDHPHSDVLLDVSPAPVVGSTGSESAAPIEFLLSHPKCRIVVFDSYGSTWITDNGAAQQVSGRDDRLSRTPIRDAEGVATGEWVSGVYPPEGMSECSCYIQTAAIPLHSRLVRENGWLLCTSCGGTYLVGGT